jgi:hypothetical protein
MKNKAAFETEVYVCINNELVQQDAEIQYFSSLNMNIEYIPHTVSARHNTEDLLNSSSVNSNTC